MQTCRKLLFTLLLVALSFEYSNLSQLLHNYIDILLKNKNYCGCSALICCCEKNSLEDLCIVSFSSSEVPPPNNTNKSKSGQTILDCSGQDRVISAAEFKKVLATQLPELSYPLFIQNERFAFPGTLKPLLVKNEIFHPPKTSIL